MSSSDPADRFSFLMSEINTVTGVLASHGAQISALSDQLLVTRCQILEENCGRINTDNLRHVMVIGGPYLPLGTDIQERLKKQVYPTIPI